jgi:hypothetical protein
MERAVTRRKPEGRSVAAQGNTMDVVTRLKAQRPGRVPVVLALAALALATPLAAVAQAPTQTFTNERLDQRTLQDVEVQASVVTAATVRSSDVFDSRIHGASVFTSNLEGNAVSRALLQNDRMRLAALDRVTVEDSRLQGIAATRAAFRATELRDFSIRGASVEGGSLVNGIIQDVALSGGVRLCNVYDRTSGRYFTTGCTQMGEPPRPEDQVRGTGRDLERTLLGALTLARDERLQVPQIREQGFFVRVGEEGGAPPSADTVLGDIAAGSVPDTGQDTPLPPSAPGEVPALPPKAGGAPSVTPTAAPGGDGGLPSGLTGSGPGAGMGELPYGDEGLPAG